MGEKNIYFYKSYRPNYGEDFRVTYPLSPAARQVSRNVTERGHRRAKNPHAQAPSVPMRRAGRRARDEARVLPYVPRGEKSVNGGIHDPSVAPHLHRKFLREVRSEFSWTVDGAAEQSSGTLVTLTYTSVCSSCNFFFKQRKVYKTPFWEGK